LWYFLIIRYNYIELSTSINISILLNRSVLKSSRSGSRVRLLTVNVSEEVTEDESNWIMTSFMMCTESKCHQECEMGRELGTSGEKRNACRVFKGGETKTKR
jgi:hypothetical protein